MKKIYILIGAIVILFSCQENEEQDWKKQIENNISSYNKNAEIDEVLKDSVNGGEEIFTFYKLNNNDLYKIEVSVNYGFDWNMNSVVYVLNESPIYSEFKGYMPYLHKSQKKRRIHLENYFFGRRIIKMILKFLNM